MAWPWNGTDTFVDAPTAAPADTPISTPAAFMHTGIESPLNWSIFFPGERDFSGVPRSTSEAVQPD
jgi:hypothetical protein